MERRENYKQNVLNEAEGVVQRNSTHKLSIAAEQVTEPEEIAELAAGEEK